MSTSAPTATATTKQAEIVAPPNVVYVPAEASRGGHTFTVTPHAPTAR